MLLSRREGYLQEKETEHIEEGYPFKDEPISGTLFFSPFLTSSIKWGLEWLTNRNLFRLWKYDRVLSNLLPAFLLKKWIKRLREIDI
jgi:hypothetical protein